MNLNEPQKVYNGSNDLYLSKANNKVEDIEAKIRQAEA